MFKSFSDVLKDVQAVVGGQRTVDQVLDAK